MIFPSIAIHIIWPYRQQALIRWTCEASAGAHVFGGHQKVTLAIPWRISICGFQPLAATHGKLDTTTIALENTG
jgi:hypothetical protein